ncbi:MAG: OmpH family outer membrane protein [Chitinivibrionales bacterium]
MKKGSIISLILSTILALSFSVSAELKIGYVDSDKILMEYEGAKSAQKQMQDEYQKLEQKAAGMQKDVMELRQQLQKQSLILSDEKKKEIQEKLVQKESEYKEFLQENMGQEGQVNKRQQEVFKPIIEKINSILKDIAKKENYDFIFDSRMGVVWAKQAYDLTDQVLKVLNKQE